MSMNTFLAGRLRNTPLPRTHGLMPLFEAVVNSIQAVASADAGEIVVEIERSPQHTLQIEGAGRRGAPPQEAIVGFRVRDNGCGFDDSNLRSFETLDSDYKASEGCRGIGRLLWLKAFDSVQIKSNYPGPDGEFLKRSFTFTASKGIDGLTVTPSKETTRQTEVHLCGFKKEYRERAAKTGKTIANALFEHCLWYFVRDGGAPKIKVVDHDETILLSDVYEECMHSSAQRRSLAIKGERFELTHLKLKASTSREPFIAWCAASRVVKEEGIIGKVSGLHGRIVDDDGDFLYACYVTSPFLDQHVRPERIGFDIEEISEGLFAGAELSLSDIRAGVLESSKEFLDTYLQRSRTAGRERVEKFVSQRAPRYRPILARISEEKLSVDPSISDRELDLLLHKQLSEIENSLLAEGHSIMTVESGETSEHYRTRLNDYLSKVEVVKMSDLAGYVFHRKIILDILQKAIERGDDGKYAREELIHEVIMPMRKTSDDLHEKSNLWLIDERLSFHDFLASDKPLSSMPIVQTDEAKEPDIVALNVFDEPLLVAEGQRLPLASLVVVEIKRPMRNDAASGEDKDPIEQALGYLDRIRNGQTQTASGRPIPRSEEIPGFCYVICDITPSIERRCKLAQLTVTSDRQGYFGYNPNYKAYIEVISFDRLLNGARERNRAFFDKLGLPTNL